MSILAIDPGLNNGIAVLDGERRLLLATEIPPIGEGASRRLNMTSFADILVQFHVAHAVVEDVSAMPKQGVSSTFRFGRAAGALEGALAALRVPTTFVRPAIWKRDIGAKAKQAEDVRALAIQTWPDMAHRFARSKDHSRAEAALLGLWFLQHSGWRSSDTGSPPTAQLPAGSRVFVGGEGWKTVGKDTINPGSSVWVDGGGWVSP
jgi:crossover junction endodeoxyribonuclease RuvC